MNPRRDYALSASLLRSLLCREFLAVRFCELAITETSFSRWSPKAATVVCVSSDTASRRDHSGCGARVSPIDLVPQ